MPFVQTNATVVTIFAGVNEINTITAALGGGAGGSDPNGFIDAQVRAFGTDYTTLLAGIRARAGSPRIVILNVPNAAGLPFLAGASLAAAAGRAARGRRHDEDRGQPAGVVLDHRRRSDVRRAQLRRVELLGGRPAPERRRLRVHVGGGRQGDHHELVSRAAKQLHRDDDRAVIFADAVARLETGLRSPLPGPTAQARLAPVPRREWPAGFNPARIRNAAGLLLVFPNDRRNRRGAKNADKILLCDLCGLRGFFRIVTPRTSS